MAAKMLNRDRLLAKMRRVPEHVLQPVEAQMDVEAPRLASQIRDNAPVDETSPDPGKVRASVRAYKTPGRRGSYRIIADAKDPDGKPVATHVEQGHRAPDGSHVPAQPFFFPTYRANRKGIQRRLKAVARKAIRAEFPR